MSDQPLVIMPAAWLGLPITDGEFRVLAAICQFAHLGSEEGCLRSHEAIGEAVGMHRDTVKKAVRKLRGLSILRIEHRGGGPGERSSTNRLIPNWQVVAAAGLEGEGGSPSPRGATSPEEGGATTPQKHYAVSTQSSSPGAREETLAERFADADHREAYEGYRRSHRMPDSLDAGIRSVNQPISGGAAYDWPIIGAALLEMRATQGNFSVPFLRGCCRRLVAGEATSRGVPRGATRVNAAAMWDLCKQGGLLTAPSREALEEGIDSLIDGGAELDRHWFLAAIEHVKPWEFANARTPDWAIERVAERLATFTLVAA